LFIYIKLAVRNAERLLVLLNKEYTYLLTYQLTYLLNCFVTSTNLLSWQTFL